MLRALSWALTCLCSVPQSASIFQCESPLSRVGNSCSHYRAVHESGTGPQMAVTGKPSSRCTAVGFTARVRACMHVAGMQPSDRLSVSRSSLKESRIFLTSAKMKSGSGNFEEAVQPIAQDPAESVTVEHCPPLAAFGKSPPSLSLATKALILSEGT